MQISLDRIGRNRPDYARGATLYCRRHLIERARKYYVREAVTNYIQLRQLIQNVYKLKLDDFGNEARRRGKFDPNRPFVPTGWGPRTERTARGSLQRLAVERLAFAKLTNSRRLIREVLREKKLLSQRLVKMETSLKELGFDEQWDGLKKVLQAAMVRTVIEIKSHQREFGLGAEAYAIKSINQRRKMREIRSEKLNSSDIEKNDDTRGKLVCAICHPEAQAQQSSRPWAPRWWIAMLRGLYQSRADIGTVERALINDTEAQLCVVRGIVMVVISRKSERPHFLVLDMELLKGFGPRVITKSKPKVNPNTGLRAKTEKEERALLRQKRRQSDGNEHEPRKRRRGSSLSLA